MASHPLASRYPTGELFNSLLKQRARPYVIIVDVHLEVALADSNALEFLRSQFQIDDATPMLPAPLHEPVSHLIRQWTEKGTEPEQLVVAVGGLVVRVIPMLGPQENFYAVFIEKQVCRENLNDAMIRFSFTPREVEVLDLILDGMRAAEIAESLNIAEVTVFDHLTHISNKTQARNRADMLAKIFNWQKRQSGVAYTKEASSA